MKTNFHSGSLNSRRPKRSESADRRHGHPIDFQAGEHGARRIMAHQHQVEHEHPVAEDLVAPSMKIFRRGQK